MNLSIRIEESNEIYAPFTVYTEPVVSQQVPTVIYIRHIDEIHYVSSTPLENVDQILGSNLRVSGY